MSFVGGKLKLKGGDPLGVKKKKKKKRIQTETDRASDEEARHNVKEILEGKELPSPGEDDDRRTEAEKRHEQQLLQAEQRRLAKLAATSHRDRVNEFNEKLSNLTEHHDIPKVGPG